MIYYYVMYKVLLALAVIVMTYGVVGARAETSESVRRAQFEKNTQAKLEELKVKREENRDELRLKLQGVVDARKLQVAEGVSSRLCAAHTKRIEKLKEHLMNMSKILDRVESKTSDLEKTGKDVTLVRKEITEARAAIAAASTAVENFAAKDCGLNVTGTESQLKAELSNAVKNLERDFKALQGQLTEARKATAEAIRALAVLNNEEVR